MSPSHECRLVKTFLPMIVDLIWEGGEGDGGARMPAFDTTDLLIYHTCFHTGRPTGEEEASCCCQEQGFSMPS